MQQKRRGKRSSRADIVAHAGGHRQERARSQPTRLAGHGHLQFALDRLNRHDARRRVFGEGTADVKDKERHRPPGVLVERLLPVSVL